MIKAVKEVKKNNQCLDLHSHKLNWKAKNNKSIWAQTQTETE